MPFHLKKKPHFKNSNFINQSTTPPSAKYHIIFKVSQNPLQGNTPPSSKYHTYHPLQGNTPPSSKYHVTIFKVPYNPLQSTTPSSSKYHTTLFKVTHRPLQSTTPPALILDSPGRFSPLGPNFVSVMRTTSTLIIALLNYLYQS